MEINEEPGVSASYHIFGGQHCKMGVQRLKKDRPRHGRPPCSRQNRRLNSSEEANWLPSVP